MLALALLLALAACGGNASTSGKDQSQAGGSNSGDEKVNRLADNATVLFMGDSITDGGRTDYSVKTEMGMNHPKLFKSYVDTYMADKHITVYNTGVSGDTLLDQYFRLQEDCYDLKPDIIVMLLGVNDSWNGYKGKEVFEKTYRLLLDGMRANTDARIILVEPFLFEPNEAMQAACVIPDVGSYIPMVKEMQDVICRLAAEYQTDIVYLAEILEQLHQKGTPYQHLASDAIHPTGITSRVLMEQIMLKLGVPDFEAMYGPFDLSSIENQYK